MASLVVSTLMVAFGAWLSTLFGHWRTTFLVIDVVLTVGISAVLFALLFKYVPQHKLAWTDVWVGGVVTAVLFSIGKFAIGYYLGKECVLLRVWNCGLISGASTLVLLHGANLFVRRGIHTVLFFNFGHTRFASFTALKLGSSDHRILVCTLAHRARTPGGSKHGQ